MYRYAVIFLVILFPACGIINQLDRGRPDIDEAVVRSFTPTTISTIYRCPSKSGTILHPNPDLVRDEIMEMTGCLFAIVTEDDEKVLYRLEQITQAGSSPTLLTKDNDILFEGIVDKGTESDLRILVNAIYGLNIQEKLYVIYETIAKAKLTDESIPWDKLKEKANKLTEDDIKYYYVRSITLNRLAKKKYCKLSRKQKIQGMAFAVSDGIFHSKQEQQFSYEIIFDTIPLSILKASAILELKKSMPAKTDVELCKVASHPDLLESTAPHLLLSYRDLPYELKEYSPVGIKGKLIASYPKISPAWMYSLPKRKGLLYFTGISGTHPTEALAYKDALHAARGQFIHYISALALAKFSPLKIPPPNIDLHLTVKDYYAEKWMKPHGVDWKLHVLMEIPQKSVHDIIQ